MFQVCNRLPGQSLVKVSYAAVPVLPRTFFTAQAQHTTRVTPDVHRLLLGGGCGLLWISGLAHLRNLLGYDILSAFHLSTKVAACHGRHFVSHGFGLRCLCELESHLRIPFAFLLKILTSSFSVLVDGSWTTSKTFA